MYLHLQTHHIYSTSLVYVCAHLPGRASSVAGCQNIGDGGRGGGAFERRGDSLNGWGAQGLSHNVIICHMSQVTSGHRSQSTIGHTRSRVTISH